MFTCSFQRLGWVALCASAPLMASTLFTFDSVNPGTQTTFPYTVNGIKATFSSDCPFYVEPYSVLGQQLASGNDLLDYPSSSVCSLKIVFSQPATSISISYAFDIGSNPSGNQFYLAFSEYSGGFNGAKVASQVAYGTTLVTTRFGAYEKGVLSYSGNSFDSIQIQSPRSVGDFAIDDVAYGNSTAVPEPGTASLAILGLTAGFAPRRPLPKRP